MINGKKFLCIVAARQGSTRLPNKNIRDFNGIPLLVHTLNAINDSTVFDRTIITTDSLEIEAIAGSRGFHGIHHRSENLSTSSSIVYDAVKDVLSKVTEKYDYVMLLSPTNPLRKGEHILEAAKLACEKDADFVMSLTPCTPLEYHGRINEDGTMTGFLADKNFGKRVQDFPATYRLSASIYLGRPEIWKANNNFHSYPKVYPIVIENDIDIDTIEDFRMAEELEKRRSAKWTD